MCIVIFRVMKTLLNITEHKSTNRIATKRLMVTVRCFVVVKIRVTRQKDSIRYGFLTSGIQPQIIEESLYPEFHIICKI